MNQIVRAEKLVWLILLSLFLDSVFLCGYSVQSALLSQQIMGLIQVEIIAHGGDDVNKLSKLAHRSVLFGVASPTSDRTQVEPT